MQTNINKFKEELNALVDQGNLLRYSMALELGIADKETEKGLKELKLPSFKKEYENWYSISMQVVKQLLPDRLDDFVGQYKIEKRKNIDFLTYTISDYMIGLVITREDEILVDNSAAFPKLEQQLNIIKSAKQRLESSLFDMVEVLQADLFDNQCCPVN
jgi:hypothetical protein